MPEKHEETLKDKSFELFAKNKTMQNKLASTFQAVAIIIALAVAPGVGVAAFNYAKDLFKQGISQCPR